MITIIKENQTSGHNLPLNKPLPPIHNNHKDSTVDNDQIILQHLMKITEDLGSIKSDISNLSTSVSIHIKKDEETQAELQEKVSTLEEQHKRVKWMAAGAGAVIAGLWKVAEAFISNWSGHH